MKRARVVVAMSGGVDSSIAAALLLEGGCEVEGVSLRLWDSPRRDDRICSDSRDAKRVADFLGIPHAIVDRRETFEARVVAPFVEGYAAGRTPNPCIACNSEFKLGWLLDWAAARGAVVATGHYARLDRRDGRVRLLRGVDRGRDQSYFLFRLTQAQLERTLLPLGEWTKEDVRRRARSLGLPVADKPDSQDLCLGAPGSLVASRGRGGRAGEIVDPAGRPLGAHRGIEQFTVGQRRGLGVAAAAPLYVRAIDAATARVTVAPSPPRAAGLRARDWSWIGSPPSPDSRLTVQVRYRHPGVGARVTFGSHREGLAEVAFDRPLIAVAPGQAVVAFDEEEVLGGGWIEEAIPVAA